MVRGIVVVAAAGNIGTAPDAVSYAPANDPYVITVGAVDDQGTRSTRDDVETTGRVRASRRTGWQSPTCLPPGRTSSSTLAPNSAFATLCPTCVIGERYFQASGTSMAAPIVAGVAADLIVAHPRLDAGHGQGRDRQHRGLTFGRGSEVDAIRAYHARDGRLASDQDLTPNSLIDPRTGTIDYSRRAGGLASWSAATDPLAASWSAASWSCATARPAAPPTSARPPPAGASRLGHEVGLDMSVVGR